MSALLAASALTPTGRRYRDPVPTTHRRFFQNDATAQQVIYAIYPDLC